MRRYLPLVLLLAFGSADAQITKLFPTSPPGSPVLDQAALLDVTTEQALVEKLVYLQKVHHADIAVVTLPTIGSYQPYEVGMTIGRTWKVGGKGQPGDPIRNLGAVILIVPRVGSKPGKCFISPGMGAEGVITDARAGQMCRDAFKRPEGTPPDYNKASLRLVDDVSARLILANTPKPILQAKTPKDSGPGFWIWLLGLGAIAGAGYMVYRMFFRPEPEPDPWQNSYTGRPSRARGHVRRHESFTVTEPSYVPPVVMPPPVDDDPPVRRSHHRSSSSDSDYGSSSSSSSSSSDWGSSSSSPSFDFGGGGGFSGGGGGSDI